MIKIRYKLPECDERYPDDVTRIVNVMRSFEYEISRVDAREAWSDYSDTMCAGWLNMSGYSDPEIIGIVLARCARES